MKTTLAVIFSCVLVSSLALGSQSQSGERSSQWQILTKANFSSQIRLHPHLLLLITVPWSGEAQSLMKELANVVTEKQEKLGAIKLMLIYRNSEKVLADALGAMEEITILNYHHSVPYKYQGRLRPQNILSSAYSLMSFFPEELPLKPLKTHEELKLFLESTDKALLLLEFCGWTPRLLAKGKNNGTEDAFGEQGVPFGLDFKGETNITLEPRGNENQKGMQNEKLNCGIENGFNDIPWLGDFSRVNDSDPYLGTENITPGVKLSCTIEEFKQFDFFLSKFMTVAGEFFLPLERQRFGLVSNRSLLSSLDIGDSGSWFAMVYFAGCPSCSKILKEGDDLRSVLQTQNSLVAEMEDDGHDTEPTLPSSEPSVVLFVDRSSDSSRIRRKSKAALNAFRELALDYQISFQMGGQSDNKPDKPSLQVYHASGSKFGHPKLSVSPTSQEMKAKDKISVMVINKGKRLDSITSDLQGSSLNEILGYLLQHKKKAKLSSLAKEVGFQLLSDDFDVKIADTSTSQAEPQSSQVSPELSVEGLVENSADLDKDQSLYTAGISAVNMAEESKPTVVEPSSEHGKERTTHVVTSTQSPSIEPAQFLASHELAITEDLKVEEKGFSQLDQLGKQQKYSQGFKGSFFFSDGGYRLLRALTSGSKIPSAVIIDPILQQHYVFPENTVFSYSSLATFLDGFCNGSLLPYQHSDSVVLSPREAPRPPFVNLDFHEVDFIPRVTTHTFSELVLGFNKSSSQYGGHAWKKDVLVLFTNNWCGFCLRMELVVREIYQAIKGYMNMLKSGSENGQPIFSSNNSKDATLKLPLIYLMDCTLNECSLILKSNDQREIYPALVLFPAETKNALSYEGDMAVTDVIKFIAGHGSNSHHLMGDNGILWTKAEKKIRNQNLFKEASPTIIHEEAPVAKEKQHEVLLKNRNPKRAYKYNRIRSYTSSRSHEAAYHVVVGSILVATDKLLDAHPFDKSTILIVKADQADLCIDDFMIRQFLQGIQIPEIRRILISEVNDETFLCRLKNLPPIRQMFDLVIQVNVKFCLKIKDIEDRIIEELGFSTSSRGEAEQLLRSQNFLILLDDFDTRRINLHDLGNGWWNSDNTQKIALISFLVHPEVPVDLEIKRNHHLLSWELFSMNVGEVVHSSTIQKLAVHVLKQCSGHLLATVLMARALKEVKDVRIWQHASRVISFLPTSHTEDRILLNALSFVLGHLGSANKYVKYCASYLEIEGTYKVDLLERWMNEDLIGTLDEGEQIVQHLVNALLLESFQNGQSIRMRDEIRKELMNFYKAETNPILLVELDGRGLMEAPKNGVWEEANEMHLMNNKISKLPDNPNSPKLSVLFLQGNHHLRVISTSFFQCMPILQILDLSQTKIKSLPQSFFKLVQLQKFILRSCELFKELPIEVGELCHLEVLDLEGTEIINLPIAIGKLTNLTCLKVSFNPQINHNRRNNHSNTIIPQNVISNLLQLEELSLDVDLEDERWNETMKDIVKEICSLNRLHSLKLHLPKVFLLNDFTNGSSSINLSCMCFRFLVGRHQKRMISRLSHEFAIKFEEQESCLKYLNGEGVPIEVEKVLKHASALFLDRHLTVTSLSEFGIKNMKNLKFCALVECNEIQTIVDAGDDRYGVLQSLEYLHLHYMKNLRSIWKGPPIWMGSLSNLKVLALHTCPELATIFTFNILQQCCNLEELVVEDCPEINSIVNHKVLAKDVGPWAWYLPKLKKMSIHYMPKLVSISQGVLIAPNLEWLSLYDCPSLKILSPEEVSSCKLKVIIGEADWWSALEWKKSERFQPPNLDAIFVPIERDIDLRTQLAEINDQLQAQMQKTEPSQQSGSGDSLKAPAVEAGTSAKQKQMKLGHLFMKWPLSELHPFLIQVP